MCVCVCVRKIERERDTETEKQRERKKTGKVVIQGNTKVHGDIRIACSEGQHRNKAYQYLSLSGILSTCSVPKHVGLIP